MSDATISAETNSTVAQTSAPTIRPDEAAHFGALAQDWWNPKGASAMLHRLNPVRLRFIREAIDVYWGGDTHSVRPLLGKAVLDVGCGAGLLCEPLARMGGDVTGVDAAPENIAAATLHAAGSGLDIRYLSGEISAQNIGQFDVITSMEVLEHVADKPAFLHELKTRLAPDNRHSGDQNGEPDKRPQAGAGASKGGLMILSTPNRTAASRLLLVEAAEAAGIIPKGTHNHDDFVTPEELRKMLADIGMIMSEPTGIAFNPVKGLHLSGNLALNYIVTARCG